MEYALVNPAEVGIWYGYSEREFKNIGPHKKLLIEYLLEEGWRKIPPVPLLRLIDKEHKYVLCDGHHRRHAALKLNHDLPAIILDKEDYDSPEHIFLMYETYQLSKKQEKSFI